MDSSAAAQPSGGSRRRRRLLVGVVVGLLVVASMVGLGLVGGWAVVFLAPVALFGLALAANVVIHLVKDRNKRG